MWKYFHIWFLNVDIPVLEVHSMLITCDDDDDEADADNDYDDNDDDDEREEE